MAKPKRPKAYVYSGAPNILAHAIRRALFAYRRK